MTRLEWTKRKETQFVWLNGFWTNNNTLILIELDVLLSSYMKCQGWRGVSAPGRISLTDMVEVSFCYPSDVLNSWLRSCWSSTCHHAWWDRRGSSSSTGTLSLVSEHEGCRRAVVMSTFPTKSHVCQGHADQARRSEFGVFWRRDDDYNATLSICFTKFSFQFLSERSWQKSSPRGITITFDHNKRFVWGHVWEMCRNENKNHRM